MRGETGIEAVEVEAEEAEEAEEGGLTLRSVPGSATWVEGNTSRELESHFSPVTN